MFDKHTYTVLIDIDDTIDYLCKAWVEWLNNKYCTNVDYNAVTDWDVSKFYPALTRDEVYEPLHDPEMWKRVKPMPDAIEYIKKMIDDGIQVYLCTSTDYRNIQPKFEYIIKEHFPYIDWNHVIVAHDKQMIKADILIDDGVHNLENGTYLPILFTAPHNRSYDAEKNKMQRVSNWKEAYDTVRKDIALYGRVYQKLRDNFYRGMDTILKAGC